MEEILNELMGILSNLELDDLIKLIEMYGVLKDTFRKGKDGKER